MQLELSDQELERYARQLIVPELGLDGQLRLKDSSVMVVGAGALGTQAAGYLAAAGVGRLGIVDPDRVELSNLQRQLLHFPPDIGVNKAEALADKLGVLNPEIVIDRYPARLVEENAPALIADHDVVVDCSDNFETRYLLNAACVVGEIPLVESGVVGLTGLVTTVIPGESACYRCMFPSPPEDEAAESCEEAGIIGPVAGIIGSLQALETIKLVTGVGETLAGKVLQLNGLDMTVTSVRAERRGDCEDCA